MSPPQRFHPWYDILIDELLANPKVTLAELSTRLGYSPTWLSIVQNSDVFQERFKQRRDQLNEHIQDGITSRLAKVASRGLDILEERLSPEAQEKAKTPTKIVKDVTETALTKLGFGAPQGAQTVVNFNQFESKASRGAIQSARENIRRSQFDQARAEAIEVEEAPAPASPALESLPTDGRQLDMFPEREAGEPRETGSPLAETQEESSGLPPQESAEILDLFAGVENGT